jgi:ketosteroid isomerase-like protein
MLTVLLVMNSSEINVVEAFIAAINRHDIADLSNLMTEDHTFVDPAGKSVSGRENMSAGWRHYLQMFPDYAIHVERLLADNSVVAVFGSASGTYNGKRGLVPQNRIAMPAAWRALIESGKIKRWQVYADWTEGSKIMAEDQKAS